MEILWRTFQGNVSRHYLLVFCGIDLCNIWTDMKMRCLIDTLSSYVNITQEMIKLITQILWSRGMSRNGYHALMYFPTFMNCSGWVDNIRPVAIVMGLLNLYWLPFSFFSFFLKAQEEHIAFAFFRATSASADVYGIFSFCKYSWNVISQSSGCSAEWKCYFCPASEGVHQLIAVHQPAVGWETEKQFWMALDWKRGSILANWSMGI